MSVNAINFATPSAARRGLTALQQLGRPANSHDPAVIRQAASQMVSELFFKPLLAELRSSPFAAEFAHGGQTEAVFGEQLDERIADAVANADRGGLVDQLVTRLERAARAGAPTSWHTQLQAQALPETRKNEPN